MTRTQIIRWFTHYRNNILSSIHASSRYCMPGTLPISEDYVYKNTLGIKFFIVKNQVTAEMKMKVNNSKIFEPQLMLKHTATFEEIYFIDYNSNNDSLTYVYAKDVNSGCYDTHMGLAIDLTKIPKNIWTFLHRYDDYTVQILTLDEVFLYKDIIN